MAIVIRSALRTQVAWAAMTAPEQAVYTGGHYTSITAWEAAKNTGDFTINGLDKIERLEVFNDQTWSIAFPDVEFTGGTHDANNYLHIVAAAGHEWDFVNKVGARVNRTGGSTYGFIVRSNNHLKVENIGTGLYGSSTSYFYTGGLYSFNRCDFFGHSDFYGNLKVTLTNCLIRDQRGRLINIYANNCTFIRKISDNTVNGATSTVSYPDICVWSCITNSSFGVQI